MSIEKYVQFERMLLDKYIYSLPSPVLVLMALLCIVLFFKTMTLTVGEDLNKLKKVDGILYKFECQDGTRKFDIIHLKTSLSESNSLFYGSLKCRSLGWVERLSGQDINYNVTFYVNKSKADRGDKPTYIYGIDYKGEKFMYPPDGLGESERFNLFCILFLLGAYGISCALFKRWKGVEPTT